MMSRQAASACGRLGGFVPRLDGLPSLRGKGRIVPKGFLPNTDAALLAWSLNFSTRITAGPVPLGLTALQATAYAALHTSYATALAACDPGERSKSLVAAKNTARLALKTSARLLAKLV